MKAASRVLDPMSRRPAGAASGSEARQPMAPPVPSARVVAVSERAAGFAGRVMVSPRPAPSLASAALGAAGSPPVRPAPNPGSAGDYPAMTQAPPRPSPGFHGAVSEFKRRLIEATLTELGGNRTRAARALGLQRTYLLRLMREFEVNVPATAGHPRRSTAGEAAVSPPTR